MLIQSNINANHFLKISITNFEKTFEEKNHPSVSATIPEAEKKEILHRPEYPDISKLDETDLSNTELKRFLLTGK